eukprot:COSAG02_NODE_457_length_21950_cov_35.452794_7_plen_47_part_00
MFVQRPVLHYLSEVLENRGLEMAETPVSPHRVSNAEHPVQPAPDTL